MEVIGYEYFPLDNGEVNFNLIEPTGMDRGVYEKQVGPLRAEAVNGPLAAMSGAVVHNPEDAPRWRDPDFAIKAGRILDLYNHIWKGRPLHAREFVISADEKSSIQARRRKQPTLAPAPGRATRIEHEYFREGA